MKILAFDTSSDVLSAGIYEEEKVLAEASPSGFALHSEVLLPVLEKLFRSCRLALKEIDLIVVGLGPGSFTGLRVGITTAKMLGFTAKKKIIGIPSFEILGASQEVEGPLAVLADAKRDKVYAWVSGSKKTELTDMKKFISKVPRGAAVLTLLPLDLSSKKILERKGCRILPHPKPVSAFHAARLAGPLA